jgi:hypothetical protein
MSERAKMPLWQRHMGWCRHFNGMMHESCKAGVLYEEVRDTTTRPYGYPCFLNGPIPHGAIPCAAASFPTEEEGREWERGVNESAARFASELAAGRCPHCGRDIVRKRQVGRCVYADPCGCRLYQGKLAP